MSEKSKIRVLVVRPGQEPSLEEIENSLPSFQIMVGGYVEQIYFRPGGLALICDEDGKVKNLARNFVLPNGNDTVVGTALFAISSGEEFASVSEDDVAYATRWVGLGRRGM